MIGLDTNVLIRYLVQDDRSQSDRATRLIETAQAEKIPLWISLITACELVWVLESAYGARRKEVMDTLEELAVAGFVFADADLVREAIRRVRGGKADFADYVAGLLAEAVGVTTVYTFDKKLRAASGFHLL